VNLFRIWCHAKVSIQSGFVSLRNSNLAMYSCCDQPPRTPKQSYIDSFSCEELSLITIRMKTFPDVFSNFLYVKWLSASQGTSFPFFVNKKWLVSISHSKNARSWKYKVEWCQVNIIMNTLSNIPKMWALSQEDQSIKRQIDKDHVGGTIELYVSEALL